LLSTAPTIVGTAWARSTSSRRDGCRLPAELERDLLQHATGDRTDLATNGGRTGERDHRQAWMGNEVRTDVAAAGDHTQHALRKAGGVERVGDGER
jgi:hypothetical protein